MTEKEITKKEISRRGFLGLAGAGLLSASGCPNSLSGVYNNPDGYDVATSLLSDGGVVYYPLESGNYPLLVNSHGLLSYSIMHNIEHIYRASKGNVVLATNHNGDRGVNIAGVNLTGGGSVTNLNDGFFVDHLNDWKSLEGHGTDTLEDLKRGFYLGMLGEYDEMSLREDENRVVREVIDYRPKEVYRSIKELEWRNNDNGFFNPLSGKVDFDKIIFEGHSAGGYTALACGVSAMDDSSSKYSDEFDFSEYKNSLKGVITKAGATGYVRQDEIARLEDRSVLLMAGQNDELIRNTPLMQIEQSSNSNRFYSEIREAGHISFGEIVCMNETLACPVIANLIAGFVPNLTSSGYQLEGECRNIEEKHEAMKRRTEAVVDYALYRYRDENFESMLDWESDFIKV